MERRLILRFRDLVTEDGGTIAEHRAMLQSHGEVWWGWWMRQYETPPRELFGTLCEEIARAGPVPGYLFNTGEGKLFSCKIADIRMAPTGTKIGAPDVERSPEYYSRGRYPAWFLLVDSIDERHFYDRSVFFDAFPSRPEMPAPLRPLLDQRVRSLEDLRHADVTLWMVREGPPEIAAVRRTGEVVPSGVILSGLLAAGKSTVERLLVERHGFRRPATVVTRVVDRDEPSAYVQCEEEEFIRKAKSGDVVVPFRFGKTWYGYDRQNWEQILRTGGRGWVFNVRPYAGLSLAAMLPETRAIWLEAPEKIRTKRLAERAADRDRGGTRTQYDEADRDYRKLFRYTVSSVDAEECLARILEIAEQ